MGQSLALGINEETEETQKAWNSVARMEEINCLRQEHVSSKH